MIGNTFSETCKSLGTTTNDFSAFTGVPLRTLSLWFNSKPLLIQRLFEAYRYYSIMNEFCKPAAGDSVALQASRPVMRKHNNID